MDSTGKVAKSPQLPPQATSAVLGNDGLLREILLRLDFPTCLVRAAAVSRRWLRHASDPAFLRRFRGLHPPRLLGFYLNSTEFGLRFMPLPQPPELAAVICRGKFDLGRGTGRVLDCRNGRLILYIKAGHGRAVCRPLRPERGISAFPRPNIHVPAALSLYSHELMLHDEGGDDMAISAVFVMGNVWKRQARVLLRDFQSGEWGKARNSDVIQLPGPVQFSGFKHLALLSNGKIYVMCMTQYIFGLDVQSMSLFSIKIPDGVEYDHPANIALSRAEGYAFCLVHARSFQISVWLYTLDYSSTGNWELIDTICLHQVFGPNADPNWSSQGVDVQVVAVGDNAEFVFLRMQKKVFYLHISSRTVEKVHELAQREALWEFFPFMMVWPPTFPTLNSGHDKDE